MKRNLKQIGLFLLLCCAGMTSCVKETTENLNPEAAPATRAFGDKTPIVATYIDVTKTNPLNAGLYRVGEKAFFDIAILQVATAKSGGEGIQANEELAAVLENAATYIRPLQALGIKVLLGINGYHSGGYGICNLTPEQADKQAASLALAVEMFGLDGIDFFDEMITGGTSTKVENSFSNIITGLRARLDAKYPGERKLITALDLNNSLTLNAQAVAALDYLWGYDFSATYYNTKTYAPDVPVSKWAPFALRLDLNSSSSTVRTFVQRTIHDGAGAVVTYNLLLQRECDPLNLLISISLGAGWDLVTRDSGATGYVKDWTPAAGPLDIVYVAPVEPEPPFYDPELGNQTPLDSMKLVKAVLVDTSVANALNAGAYVLPDGSPFFDLVTVSDSYFSEMSDRKPHFVGGAVDPSVVQALQDKGMKVLLKIRSGSGRWGFANLSDEFIELLSNEIRDVVIQYKYNGVELLDMDATYDSGDELPVDPASYSKMILALREKLSDKRVIVLRDIGYSNTLTPEAIQAVDRIWTFSVGATVFNAKPSMTGLPNRKWAPMRIPMVLSANSSASIIISNTGKAIDLGMGAIAFDQLTTMDISKALTAVAQKVHGQGTIISRTAVYEK